MIRDLTGKTAFVTGGASGIGRALGCALLEAGASVMLADIERNALEETVAELAERSPRVEGVVCDVSDRESLFGAAARTFEMFGHVHLLCNNAGVSRAGVAEEIAPADWQWVIGVNLMGTIHGIQAFLPRMKAHPESGHIVNTASMSGMVPGALSGPYAATKFAIVGLSEVLAAELDGTNVGVSVLCPAWVHTRMPENGRNRPERFGGAFDLKADVANAERNARYAAANESGLDPSEVAMMVLAAVQTNQFYVFTHADRRADVEARHERILRGFDAAEERQPAADAMSASRQVHP